jgi:type VI secretion system protein ImpK
VSPAPFRQARAHPNPLVAAFAPLLEIAPELERATAPASAASLRVRLYDNLIQARDAVVGRGVALTRADQAAWFVAALIDDLAMNTPWGGHSDWPRQPLVVSLAGDVDAGSRFFERLAEYQRYPERDPEMLELAHICLGLGFRGRFRVEGPQAQGALLQARTTSARLLRDADADRSALSPNWEGVNAPDTPRRFAVPLWTIGLATVAVVAAIHTGLGVRLSQKGEALYTLAMALPPPERAEVFRPVRESAPDDAPVPEEAPAPIQPVVLEMLPLFQQAAPPNLASALTGREDVSLSVLVIRGTDPEVFRSARADVNEEYLPLIESIARTIVENGEVIGGVTVIGHTDSVPVQASNPFQSNQGLSEARAQTIARLLAEAGVPYELLRAEGRADTEPVADNATREGRAQNRRVEIRIEKRL